MYVRKKIEISSQNAIYIRAGGGCAPPQYACLRQMISSGIGVLTGAQVEG